MSDRKLTHRRRASNRDTKTETPGVYRRGSHYRVLTRPDGKRKVMVRFETYEAAAAFKATTPNLTTPGRARERAGWDRLPRDPCPFCDNRADQWDHIVPLAAGGDDHWSNITPICASCNSAKRAKSLLWFLLTRQGCGLTRRWKQPPGLSNPKPLFDLLGLTP